MTGKIHPEITASKITVLFVCAAFFVCACSPVPSLPATTTASAAAPTFTPAPESTATPLPSATPVATFTPMVTGLGELVFAEDFDGLEFSAAFSIYGSMRMDNGTLVMELQDGEAQPLAGSFSHEFYGGFNIAPDMTAVVRFRVKPDTVFQIGYMVRNGGNGKPVRFNFNSGAGRWELYGDGPQISQVWAAQQPRADVWQYLSLHRTASGEVDAKLWEADDPTQVIEFHQNLGTEWGTLELTFFIFSRGSLALDEYQQFK